MHEKSLFELVCYTRDNARKYVNCLLSNFKLSDALFFQINLAEGRQGFFFFFRDKIRRRRYLVA